MDELNKLKKAWDNSFEGEEVFFPSDSIREVISRKSSGTIDKLKRSLYLEIGTIILVLPLLVWVLFTLPQPYFLLNTSLLILLFVFILIYYTYNLKKVTAIWHGHQTNLRESLMATVAVFRFFRKTYFYLNIALFPLALYFGYVIGFGLGTGGERITELFYNPNISLLANIAIYIIVFAFIFGAFLLFLRFYMTKLYDVHIHKLNAVLEELMEHES